MVEWVEEGGGAFEKIHQKLTEVQHMQQDTAKHLVAAGLASRCEIQLAYVIGVAEPVSIMVESFGTGTLPDAELTDKVKSVFDFRPSVIAKNLNLLNPIYSLVSRGHAEGSHNGTFPWEEISQSIISELTSRLSTS